MNEDAMMTIGRPDALAESLGLTPQSAAQVGTIIVFAADVEFRLERAIWRLQDHDPRGVQHATDAKPIGKLIDMFAIEGSTMSAGPEQQLVELWCSTARSAFDFRHSIAHGTALRLGTVMSFQHNRSWEGEIRKRPAASLWGDQNTLENLRLTFALLLQIIRSVSNNKNPMQNVASPRRLDALRSAKSLMDEMTSGGGPWFEKY